MPTKNEGSPETMHSDDCLSCLFKCELDHLVYSCSVVGPNRKLLLASSHNFLLLPVSVISCNLTEVYILSVIISPFDS